MSKTNFEKLTRWDSDYYKSLSDDDCIICLTEREVYLIGQIIEPLTWSGTRWLGDIVGLDFKAISAQLEYKLSERVTCRNLTQILTQIEVLADKVNTIYNDMIIENGGSVPTYDTPADEQVDYDEIAADYSEQIGTSCTNDDKDALYAGIFQFVRYVNQVNIDALQELAQLGNYAEAGNKLISGFTGGLLPIDEAVEYAQFLLEELLDEYETIVTEELLNTVTCDLFCIAVSNNCTFILSDAINFYGSKIGTDALGFANALSEVVVYGLTGTFVGEQYFYYMHTFQFIATALAQNFGGTTFDKYMLQFHAGANSPDADWTLLCDACPPMYRLWTHNFAYGLGDFVLNGDTEFTGSRVKGAGTDLTKTASITLPAHNAAHRVRSILVSYERVNGDGIGGLGHNRAEIYVNGYSGSNLANCADGLSNGNVERGFDAVSYVSGGTSLGFFFTADNTTGVVDIYIDKIEIVYDIGFAPQNAVITDNDDLCP